MALADFVAGAMRPSQTITWARADGTPEDLTGATLSGVLRNRHTGASRAIAGTLEITAPAAGQFRWNYDAADVLAGAYDVQFTATFASGNTPARTFATTWHVAKALTV